MKKFIFDIDGTLTPSRARIHPEFKKWFEKFQTLYDTYLVTGSDRPKTIEQVGEDIYNGAKRVYNCSGSDVWEQDKNVHSTTWRLPSDAREWLEQQLQFSEFPRRTGNHIEDRQGMVNFSVVGRNATRDERVLYMRHDEQCDERITIAKDFKRNFPDIEAKVGGETGIDIFPVGADKSQILRDFDANDRLYFFGDKMDKDGNDYPLSKVINDKQLGVCYHVTDYEHTWNYLRYLG